MTEMVRACSLHGESKGAYGVVVGKPEGRRPLERPTHRWEDNINMDLVGWGHGLNRCGSRQEQVAGCCKFRNEHSGSIKYGKFLE
jgi:hypothetical protein